LSAISLRENEKTQLGHEGRAIWAFAILARLPAILANSGSKKRAHPTQVCRKLVRQIT
jgi:hypothetical protein